MRHAIIFLAVFVAAVLSVQSLPQDPHLELFHEFERNYSKAYESLAERAYRFGIFKDNLKRAEELNRRNGEPAFGVTKFMDLHADEFRAAYLMPTFSLNVNDLPEHDFVKVSNYTAVPTTFDWRDKNMVTAVKNQEQCGSCWAFSATEQIESVWAIAGHSLVSLAPQQIVDCDKTCYGCNGGWSYLAFQYVIQAGGLEPETDYPYKGTNGACHFVSSDVAAKISAWKYVSKVAGDEETVMVPFVANTAPLSVCVDASSWQLYRSGVLRQCGQQIDHCVQITGYSTQNGINAWNVRNSWGADWGVQGYIYVERDKNLCAIATIATTATAG